MIVNRLRYITVNRNIWRYLASNAKRKSRKDVKKQKDLAFPPEFESKLASWPSLIQMEIDERMSEAGKDVSVIDEGGNASSSNPQSIEVNYSDYYIDPNDGIIAQFHYDQVVNILMKVYKRGSNVILIEQGEKTKKYEAIVMQQYDKGIMLKLTRYGKSFNPNIASECKYFITPSEVDTTLHMLKEFLEERDRWKNLPGYNILQHVYRAKAFKSLYNDRNLSYHLDLNESQKAAVCGAMNNQRPIFCIQGPPGTGKSHVLTEIILQANRAKMKVLICAPTHQAVDNLMVRVQKHISNVHSLRNKDETTNTINAAMETHSDFDLLAQMYDEITNIKKGVQNDGVLKELSAKAIKLKNKIRNAILSSSDIIFTTLSSVSVRTLRHFGFCPDLVIIEEAGQAIECASWVALLQAPRGILAGDPCQLRSNLQCQEAKNQGLNKSLMEVVQKEFGKKACILLNEQYRMNETIQNWSSKHFYGSELKPNDALKNIRLSDVSPLFEDKCFQPLVFVDTDLAKKNAEDVYHSSTTSYSNPYEAHIVVKHLDKLCMGGLSLDEIGVITGYREQVLLIRNLMRRNMTERVDICSVDGFQGEEREAIIMSFVRNNVQSQIGFLYDFRRMNVAMTRAKRHVFFVGSSRMLRSGSAYLSSLYDEMKTNGIVYSPDEYLSLDLPHLGTSLSSSSKRTSHS
uniref:Helicase ATP-binding domain-containing protein n=1 Tax=Panagrolaimus sp. JU765 TaxID=591449 RepID=A0AC34Q5W8_9BILA